MVILTEKPNVAKDIAAGLGGFSKEDGVYKRGGDCIVSAHGHLLKLFMPEDYAANLKAWRMETLPIVPEPMRYKPITDPKNALKTIEKAFKDYGTKDFVLATDAEREGELIGAIIMQYLKFGSTETAKRFWVSEALTPEVVRKGMSDAKPLSEYDNYKKAGYARQHADWLIGINISRVIGIQTGMTGGSFGRVQTAILGAIYARDKSIKEFKAEPYNQVEVIGFTDGDGKEIKMSLSVGGKTKFPKDSDIVENALSQLETDTRVTVANIKTEHKTENPPQLFNITGLQKHCSSKFKMSPARTLEIAQKLYDEKKCLSYPRTPSTVLGDENVELFREKFETLSKEYTELAQGCEEKNISEKNKRIFNTEKLRDHHALIPLAKLPENASGDERNVYFSVLERFFQTIKKPFVYDATQITAAKDDIVLTATGRQVIDYGWKEKNTENDNEDQDGMDEIPLLSEGKEIVVFSAKKLEKFTKPKKHYTNATLLSLMENPKGESEENFSGKMAGLGTPATRAEIIQTLLTRQYVAEEKQSLVITKKGEFLIDAIKTVPSLAKMISLSTTTEWEQMLQDDPDGFLRQIKDFIKAEVPGMRISARWQKDSIGKCPICKDGNVTENAKSYSCDRYKDGCKFTIWKETCGAKVTADDAKLLLLGKSTKIKKMKSKTGKEFSASLVLKDGKTEFVFEERKKK